MSFRDTGRPAQPGRAALEASSRDFRDGEVRHSAMSFDQVDVPWPEAHWLRRSEGAAGEAPSRHARRGRSSAVGRTNDCLRAHGKW